MGPLDVTKICMMAAWVVGWILLFWAPRLRRKAAALDLGDEAITIVIPARNEASSLPNLLDSLADQRPDGARVIVVNDGSEDDTADIARRYDFVEVIDADPLRDGWIGKTWACHTGAALAKPGTLIFIDADVKVYGDALTRAVAEQRERGGLLTIWPRHVVKRPYEYFSALFNVITMMGVGAGSLFRPRTVRGGFGPLMVMSTADYAHVGGHESVKGCVVDDFALARRFTDTDRPVRNLAGGRDVSFRMYPDGFGSLLEGWTKNMSAGAVSVSLWRTIAIGFWLTFAVGSIKWGGAVPRTFPTTMVVLYVLQILIMIRQLGNFGLLTALLYPFHVLVVVIVLLRSIYRSHIRRSVVWRGREIPMGGVSGTK